MDVGPDPARIAHLRKLTETLQEAGHDSAALGGSIDVVARLGDRSWKVA